MFDSPSLAERSNPLFDETYHCQTNAYAACGGGSGGGATDGAAGNDDDSYGSDGYGGFDEGYASSCSSPPASAFGSRLLTMGSDEFPAAPRCAPGDTDESEDEPIGPLGGASGGAEGGWGSGDLSGDPARVILSSHFRLCELYVDVVASGTNWRKRGQCVWATAWRTRGSLLLSACL